MKFLTDIKIRCIISLAVYLLLPITVFLPQVTILNTNLSSGLVAEVSQSVIWYLSEAGIPEIYTISLIIYFAFSLFLIVSVFLRELRTWPVLLTAVFSVLFLAFHGFWTGIVFYAVKSTVGTCSFTVWSWIFILFMLIWLLRDIVIIVIIDLIIVFIVVEEMA